EKRHEGKRYDSVCRYCKGEYDHIHKAEGSKNKQTKVRYAEMYEMFRKLKKGKKKRKESADIVDVKSGHLDVYGRTNMAESNVQPQRSKYVYGRTNMAESNVWPQLSTAFSYISLMVKLSLKQYGKKQCLTSVAYCILVRTYAFVTLLTY
ncbi:hypothetical protein Tco_0722207, partial [Tanacetum coccineum]